MSAGSGAPTQGRVFARGLCRCCGIVRQCQLFTLTAEYENPDFGKEIYSKMIMDCFGLVMSHLDEPTDHLICIICVRYLRVAVAFKEQVLQCEQAFIQATLFVRTAEEPMETKFPHTSIVTEIEVEAVKVGSPMFANDQDDEGKLETGPPEHITAPSNHIKQSETQISCEEPTTAITLSTSHTNKQIIKSNTPKPSETFNIKDVEPKINKYHDEINSDKYAEEILTPNQSKISNNSSDAVNVAENYSCDICDYTALDVNALNTHLKAHAAMERFQCDMCLYMATKKDDIISHIDTHNKVKPFSHISDNAKFKKSSHSEQVSQKHTRKHTMKEPCDDQSRFDDRINLKTHQRVHIGERPYACDACDSRFISPSSLEIHKRIHAGDKLYSCDICHLKFSQRSTFGKHLRVHTGERPYCCDVCDFRFSNSSNLKMHQRFQHKKENPSKSDTSASEKHQSVHTGEEKYSCDVCQFSCSQKGNLETHMRKHFGDRSSQVAESIESSQPDPFAPQNKLFGDRSSQVAEAIGSSKPDLFAPQTKHFGEKPYSCDVCDLRLSNSSHFKAHQMVHTGEKPYSCDVCPSRFRRKTALKRHMITHTGEKLCICDICHLRFSDRNSLRKHQSIHTGEKPYSCEVCHFRSSRKGNLVTHMRKHTGERPYSCNVCHARFSDSSYFKKHQRIHTGEKPYSCGTCHLKFARKDVLKIHEETHWKKIIFVPEKRSI